MEQLKKIQTKIFQIWFNKLSFNIQDKIMDYIDRILNGNFSNTKSLGDGLFELKINYQKGYRVYFTIIK